jgi:hypothetical protein
LPKQPAEPSDRPDGETMARIERELQRRVRQLAPSLHRERKWGVDWYVGTDLVLCVGAFSRHVGVEFWRGSTLATSHPSLEGTGKNLRHLKVRSLEEARRPSLAKIVRAAVRLDQKLPKRAR